MNANMPIRRRHSKLEGVWSLGMNLSHPDHLTSWQTLFPFMAIRRPGTIATAHAGAQQSGFDLVWAEPQTMGPGWMGKYSRSTTMNKESVNTSWQPLREKLTTTYEESIPFEKTVKSSSIGLAKKSIAINVPRSPFLLSTLFLLTKKKPALSQKAQAQVDLSQARFSLMQQSPLVTQLNTSRQNINHRINKEVGESETSHIQTSFAHQVPNKNEGTTPEVTPSEAGFPSRKTFLQGTKAETEQTQTRFLPHAIPLYTFMTRFVEELVNRKVDRLTRKDVATIGEPTVDQNVFQGPISSKPSEPQGFEQIWNENNLRQLMDKLQEFAREDRFRMGLGL